MWAVAGGAITNDRTTLHKLLPALFSVSESQLGLSANSAHQGYMKLPQA